MRSLKAKKVLVTGGARGIGLAIASRFADEGAELILIDMDEAALASAADSVSARGTRPHCYVLDVTDLPQVERVRARIVEEVGPPDVLVNNAGVVFGGAFLDVPLERHLKTFRVNVDGVVAVTHAFLADLVTRPESHVVNVASASGFVGLPYGSSYASSKWAAIGFSESLRLELELTDCRHVGVTTACPGYVDTGMFEGVRPPHATHLLTPEQVANAIVRAVLRRRIWVRMPWLIRVTPFLRGVLPTRLFDITARMMGATTSMTHWKGRGR
ncbi:MAG: SDR family oxidoreductase [bacterium]|nr:SDR family oxidoreductase [bacterium]